MGWVGVGRGSVLKYVTHPPTVGVPPTDSYSCESVRILERWPGGGSIVWCRDFYVNTM